MTKLFSSRTLLKVILRLSIMIVSVLTVWRWAFPESFAAIGGTHTILSDYGGIVAMGAGQRIAGFIIDGVPAALMVSALWRLLPILASIEKGSWFEETSERSFRKIGHLMLWYVLASWLNDTLLVIVATIANEAGQRVLMITLSTDQLLGLVPALMALVIAEMVAHARAQRDELNQII